MLTFIVEIFKRFFEQIMYFMYSEYDLCYCRFFGTTNKLSLFKFSNVLVLRQDKNVFLTFKL